MRNKKLLLTVLLFSTITVIHAQNTAKTKQLPSVAIGAGILSFNGDIGNGVNLSSFSRIRVGYHLTIEERIGKYLGVSVNGLYGKLSDSERGLDRNLNFESKIMQGDLNLVLHFDNDLIFSRTSVFAPYMYAGIGYLKFDPYGDLTNKNNVKYNYWSDGTIHDMAQSDPLASTSTLIQRDYTYETKLTDSSNYSRSSLALPLGIGFNLKVLRNLSVNMGATYYLTFTDWIDNFKSGSNDKYIYANVSIQYNFGKEEDESDAIYRSVDFSALDKMDTDEDGVSDGEDRCPGTPKGVKVTGHGCPEDNDEDGVPDYKDKELMTKRNAIVDEKGVTITDKMLSEQQSQYDSLATERSQLFNENPSLSYLKDVEAKSTEARKTNPTSASKIPYALRPADKNNDGFISADEIAAAIDMFFEGDSDFSVEKLNQLIDFFFEQ
ncbi:MAG: outer membrane beta-barrel protein [Bacteroidetes bacterium]|nr:outer membrane beta-barrel protein [Bacteroidota bacterium]